MEQTKRDTSSLAVVPASVPEPIHEIGEGTTLSTRYFEPFDFHGRVFVREYDGSNMEYITTHGPFFTELEAMVETVGLSADQIVENYCTE